MEKKKITAIDTHAHTNFHAFSDDIEEVMARAVSARVALINVGTQIETTARAVELTDKYENCYAIIGLHPIHTQRIFHDTAELGEGAEQGFTSHGEDFDIDAYISYLSHPKVVGVGETGFDYYHTTSETHASQLKAFTGQIELALRGELPLMIHTRGKDRRDMSAYHDALDIIENAQKIHGEKIRGTFHFFGGTEEVLRRILSAGFDVSFTGVITFVRDYDDVIRYAPLNRIHCETDSPFVSPLPHRGARNEPSYVQYIYDSLIAIRPEDSETVRDALLSNAERRYGIKLNE